MKIIQSIKSFIYALKVKISYLHPFKSYRHSEHSGTLHIFLRNGRKILESDNANYSFASLHRIMNFALSEVEIAKKADILLLGLWGWSALEILRSDFWIQNKIVTVDIDPVIIDVAKKEFKLEQYSDVEIICQDAYDFVAQTDNTFGLVIIDLWLDNKVPEKFFNEIFWDSVVKILSKKWQLIFNMLIETTDKEKLDRVLQFISNSGLAFQTYDKVDKTNRLVIAKK